MPRNNKFLAGISLVLTAIFLLAGCGTPLPSSVGGLLTGRTVTSVGPVGGIRVMGGAKQGVPLVLSASVTTFAGTAGSWSNTDGTGIAARFNSPFSVTTDGTNLYVADYMTQTIRQVTIASAVVTTLAGTANAFGSTDGTGTLASFNSPHGITTDGTNLYVADTANNLIRKIVISTGVVTTLAGSTSAGFADGIGTAATFSSPNGITTDGFSLYVADTGNNTIRRIDIVTGTVTTLAGVSGVGGGGNLDGVGTSAKFSSPSGITTDGFSLYIADRGNNNIRKVDIGTGTVTTIAGTGAVGSTNGTGTLASFNAPAGITMDGTNLFIADTGNQIIRKIVISTAAVTTLAGTAGTAGSTDGVGAAASFNGPAGLTTDGISLYVVEWWNGIVRKIQ